EISKNRICYFQKTSKGRANFQKMSTGEWKFKKLGVYVTNNVLKSPPPVDPRLFMGWSFFEIWKTLTTQHFIFTMKEIFFLHIYTNYTAFNFYNERNIFSAHIYKL